MRKYLTIFKMLPVLLLCSLFVGQGQITQRIGAGTFGLPFPFYTLYEDARSTMLFKASEFTDVGGGPIKKIRLQFVNTTGTTTSEEAYTFNGFTIKMQQTSLSTLAAGEIADGWTTVYGPIAFAKPVGLGWYEFEFNQFFPWDGTSNILVNICHDNTSWSGSFKYVLAHIGPPNSVIYRYADGTQGCNFANAMWSMDYDQPYRPDVIFEFATGIAGVYPEAGQVLAKGSIYQLPHEQHPGVKIVGLPANTPATVTYKIAGPGSVDNPDYQVIYRAVREIDTNNFNVDVTNLADNTPLRFTQAQGIAALRTPENNGGLDLMTNSAQIKGGEYTATAVITVPTYNLVSPPYEKRFTIALNKDIAIIDALQPIAGDIKELSRGWVPSVLKVQNLGTDTILGFNVYGTYSKLNEDSTWTVIQKDTVQWRANTLGNSPFVFSEKKDIVMPNIRYSQIGDYKAEYELEMIVFEDQDLSNNIYPRSGKSLIFNVAHSVEVYVDKMIKPKKTEKYYKGIPITPMVLYGNNGFADTVEVATTMSLYWLNPTNGFKEKQGPTLQSKTGDLIRKGQGTATFQDFTPVKEGTYIVEVILSKDRDPNPNNNTLIDTFFVIGSLSGDYTVGSRFDGNARNFKTFEDVENTLMEKGVDGPVTFLLTDSVYTVGARSSFNKAGFDISSSIVGGSKENWIKFMPHRDRYYSRASININVVASSGIGFKFGQTDYPTNNNAAIFKAPFEKYKNFANPTSSIIFDGGPYRSIKINMNTQNSRRIALYFGPGSSNDTVRNCIFSDISPTPSYSALVPLSYYDFGKTMYAFDFDSSATGTFSTAILSRSVMPIDQKYDNFQNNHRLDTLTNSNNLYVNNEISGYTYGIMSLGIGPLFDQGRGVIKPYYNTNNKILSNVIYDVKRAGILVGFEDSCQIRNNIIYNVTGVSSIPNSAGILAGGQNRGNLSAYYNTNLKIVGNEIYAISGNQRTSGILVETSLNEYETGYATARMPDQNENIHITNNIVRDLRALNANTDKFAIMVMTPRQNVAGKSKYMNFANPLHKNFTSRNALIANNTIVMENDEYLNTGMIAGIGAMNVSNAKVFSNAIAMQDMRIDTTVTNVASCVVMEGPFPFRPGYLSDRNAYEVSNGSPNTVYRFIETDSINRILDYGKVNDFGNLRQWQDWTFQDMNSRQGNFTNDMRVNRQRFFTIMRVQNDPLPTGSILNNMGEQLTLDVPMDIDSNLRGQANQRYDIGACEFSGRFYSEDVSVENIIEPRRYQAGSGDFSDAQYIMQLPPFRVEAVTRNNGMLPRSNIIARTKLFLEAADGSFVQIDSVDNVISIAPNDFTNVISNFPSSFDTLFPKAYSDFIKLANAQYSDPVVAQRMTRLYNYQVPARFNGMENNVTPRYKIRVQLVVSEQRSDNDYFEKFVRYYVPKSKIGMMISAENVKTNISNSTNPDQIAGRLNIDSLKAGLAKIGYYQNADSLNNYDVFNRAGWEERTVDYDLYHTVFWSDGNDKPLTKFQVGDIKKYLNSVSLNSNKRNLIIASQEMAREITNPNYYQYDSTFASTILRALPASPKSPLVNETGAYQSYHNKYVRGLNIQINGFNENEKISRTNFNGDAEPYPGNLRPILSGGDAVSFGAYRFAEVAPNANDSTMGIATTSLFKNVIYLSTDWRHFATNETMIRSILDFLNRNGGSVVVPVELTDFDAVKINNSVHIKWNTVYELNSNRFELEKAIANESGKTSFRTIETVKAGNCSSVPKEYGPYTDRDVTVGNKYIYRLKIVDNDGTYSYSNEVEVAFDNNELSIVKITPNPVENNAKIIFNAEGRTNVEVAVFDVTGKKVQTIFNKVAEPGNNIAELNAQNLSSGTYTIVITDGTHTVNKQIVIKK